MEDSNEVAVLALSRTRTAIRRLRLEYSILLERLEERVYNYAETDEQIVRVGAPALVDETLVLRSSKLGNTRSDGEVVKPMKRAVKDPKLPKKPTTAYTFYCESERDRLRQVFDSQSPKRPASDFNKFLLETWRSIKPDEKAPYVAQQDIDKERYSQELQVYLQNDLVDGGNKTNEVEEKTEDPEEMDETETKKEVDSGVVDSTDPRGEKEEVKGKEAKRENDPDTGLEPPAKKANVETIKASSGPKLTIRIKSPFAPHDLEKQD